MSSEAPTSQATSRLEQLRAKYKVELPQATTSREAAHHAFDKSDVYKQDKAELQRLSKKPEVKDGETATGRIHAEMAGIQIDLADLAEQYGKLNVDFSNLLGAQSIYGFGEAVRIGLYQFLGKKDTAKEIKIDAARRRGNSLEILVGKMAEVLQSQHQKGILGRDQAKTLQVENLSHMKNLDRKLIDSLRSGHYTGADLASAELEVKKLEGELKDIDATLGDYETEVNAAKASGDIEKVTKLTDEMCQVLDIKHGVLDGRLAAEGVVSEVRRYLLDSAEGVQSAKGAIAQSKASYQAINALIDAMNELEIKYRHALSDLVPVFRIQSKIAAQGMGALEIRDTLLKTAKISERLMEANEHLVLHLARETFELLQTPLYDIDRARAVEERIRTAMDDLNQQKKAWAEHQQKLTEMPSGSHYAQPS